MAQVPLDENDHRLISQIQVYIDHAAEQGHHKVTVPFEDLNELLGLVEKLTLWGGALVTVDKS